MPPSAHLGFSARFFHTTTLPLPDRKQIAPEMVSPLVGLDFGCEWDYWGREGVLSGESFSIFISPSGDPVSPVLGRISLLPFLVFARDEWPRHSYAFPPLGLPDSPLEPLSQSLRLPVPFPAPPLFTGSPLRTHLPSGVEIDFFSSNGHPRVGVSPGPGCCFFLV